MVNDVRRAYFYAKIHRDVYIELPQQDEMHGKMLGKLKLCLYGTRGATKGWQETLSAHLETIGFRRGKWHPCMFYHPSRDIRALVHGDDYVSAGGDESKLSSPMRTRSKGQKAEGKVLNRILRHTADGWEIGH